MLDELAETHRFASAPKALLDGIEGRDGGRWVVGAVEVPREKAREVLDRSEGLVAADWGKCF